MHPSDLNVPKVASQANYQVSQEVENELDKIKETLDSLKVAMESGSQGVLYNSKTGKFQQDNGRIWDNPYWFTSREGAIKTTLEALEGMVSSLKGLVAKATQIQSQRINEKIHELREMIREVGLREKIEALSEKILFLKPDDKARVENLTRQITGFQAEEIDVLTDSKSAHRSAAAAAAVAVDSATSPVFVKPPFNPTQNFYEVFQKFAANPRGSHLEKEDEGLRVVEGGRDLKASLDLLSDFLSKNIFPLEGDLGNWKTHLATLREKCAAGWIRNYVSSKDEQQLSLLENSLKAKLALGDYSANHIARALVTSDPKKREQFFEQFKAELSSNRVYFDWGALKSSHRVDPKEVKEVLLFIVKHCHKNAFGEVAFNLREFGLGGFTAEELRGPFLERVVNSSASELPEMLNKLKGYIEVKEAIKAWSDLPKNKSFDVLTLLDRRYISSTLQKYQFFEGVLYAADKIDLKQAEIILEIIKDYRMGMDRDRIGFLETILNKSTFDDKIGFSSKFVKQLENDGSIEKMDLSRRAALLKLVAKEYTKPGSYLEALVKQKRREIDQAAQSNLYGIWSLGEALGFRSYVDRQIALEADNVVEAQKERAQVEAQQKVALEEAEAAFRKLQLEADIREKEKRVSSGIEYFNQAVKAIQNFSRVPPEDRTLELGRIITVLSTYHHLWAPGSSPLDINSLTRDWGYRDTHVYRNERVSYLDVARGRLPNLHMQVKESAKHMLQEAKAAAPAEKNLEWLLQSRGATSLRQIDWREFRIDKAFQKAWVEEAYRQFAIETLEKILNNEDVSLLREDEIYNLVEQQQPPIEVVPFMALNWVGILKDIKDPLEQAKMVDTLIMPLLESLYQTSDKKYLAPMDKVIKAIQGAVDIDLHTEYGSPMRDNLAILEGMLSRTYRAARLYQYVRY